MCGPVIPVAASEKPPQPAAVEPVECSTKRCHRAQLRISPGARSKDPETESFPAYELAVGEARLHRCFGGRTTAPCHWDPGHLNAQKIWAPGGEPYRQRLRGEAAALFGGSGTRTQSRLETGDDLLR